MEIRWRERGAERERERERKREVRRSANQGVALWFLVALCSRNIVDYVLGAFQLRAGSLHPSVTSVYRPPVCSQPS